MTESERNRAGESGTPANETPGPEIEGQVAREPSAAQIQPPTDESSSPPQAIRAAGPAGATSSSGTRAGLVLGAIALAVVLALGLWSNQRFAQIESELTRRLQAAEQRVSAFDSTLGQSRDALRDLQSRNSVLESRLAETAALQAQVEKLFQDRAEDSLDVSLSEAESGLALAAQQLALGADAESVLAALQNIDARLTRQSDPRLGPVRAALARDIERLRVHPASDVGRIALRIDALLAALDPLPLISSVAERTVPGAMSSSLQPVGGAAPGAEAPAGGVQAGEPPAGPAGASIVDRLFAVLDGFGHELRQLFRVRQVDKPDAILVSPDQAYFLRQNLRLMLLNARLGLLSRNAEVYHADLERAHHWVDVYYDGEHRNVVAFKNQLRQLFEVQPGLEQARIDDSLAAVRTARAAVR